MAARDIDFVTSVYESVLDPGGLQGLTDQLMTELRASSAVMEFIENGRLMDVVTSNVPHQALTLYAEHYYKVDVVLAAAVSRFSAGDVARSSELVPFRDYSESEFYCDFAKPLGTVHILGGFLDSEPSTRVVIAVHRPEEDPDFSAAECCKLQRFLKPISSALKLKQRLGAAAGGGLAALETMAFGAIVCDGSGHIVFANGAAEALARDGRGFLLGARFGGVSAERSQDEGKLAQLIRAAAEEARAGAMTLTGDAGKPIFMLVTPLPQTVHQGSQLVLITLRAAAASPLAASDTLRELFGLTPAEARVGAALSAGAGVDDVAAELGVSDETIRTHVKRILSKTGVGNQREFVALLGLLPPLKDFSTRPS